MTRFLVNKMSEDGLSGETNQQYMVLHNLMLIGEEYKQGFLNAVKTCSSSYFVQVCICGRFVTYIEVSRDMKEWFMIFFDLQNDNDRALDAGAVIKDRWYGTDYFNWFMEETERMKDAYEVNHDACELFVAENAGLLLN